MSPGAHPPDPDGPIGFVRVVPTADAVLVTLTGEIDGELGDALDAAAQTVRDLALPVMVDATAVTFMDSTGAWFLSRCCTLVPIVVRASPQVRFLLKVLAMDDVLAPDPPADPKPAAEG
ncbi:STAS domain-containing protein [Cellulomonas sp. NS3]|uniref:STAS domain-containing protein n=1 Tax=Cellulomonas sp. NS3 TaxID=2973977 RepID=UPI0021628970|nr:sulfate transporter [Cellulomonas sp. NS3]